MAFDWTRFLERNHIHFVTSGANVSRGHIAIHCPMCGTSDPSEHMSISLASGGWRCFRRPDAHRGGNPAGLVAALLGVPYGAAAELVGSNVHLPDNLLGTVRALLGPKEIVKRKPLLLPGEFRKFNIVPPTISSHRFVNYLHQRDYTLKQILTMSKLYDLRYATSGRYKGRIIFPITFYDQLVTWTGRTIYQDQEIRYKTLSADPEIEDNPARGPITEYLLSFDRLLVNRWDCDTLILCEGPFDALKVSTLGRPYGIDATCVFTSAPSRTQMDLLYELAPNFRYRYLMFDAGTFSTAIKIQMELRSLGFSVLTLPKSLKDPGVLTEKSLLEIVS